MDPKTEQNCILSELEIDAIGEVLNISMGAAATAISSMLDKQVLITTPKVAVREIGNLDYSDLEPAVMVKITYVQGITGSNIMVFRQKDMQFILNTLMGVEGPLRDDFEFDEMSMSAASEVMNQMMGASATALSEFLGRSINISIPTAVLMDGENTFSSLSGLDTSNNIVAIYFDLSISDDMNSEFVCVITCELAKMIVNQFMNGYSATESLPDIQPDVLASAEPLPTSEASGWIESSRTEPPIQASNGSQTPIPAQTAPSEGYQQPPKMTGFGTPPPSTFAGEMPGYPTQQQGYGAPQPGYPQMQGYAGMPGAMYPPMGSPYLIPGQYPQYPNYPGYYPQGMPPYSPQPDPGNPLAQAPNGKDKGYVNPSENQVLKQAVNVQNVQFPTFTSHGQPVLSAPLTNGNIDMLMNVPLSVSIEIGRTKKKIRDIMDFNQGSIIELEKQAGAPVDIIVNGQLMARGDVVVIDDNFAVRITEIIGTKDLLGTVESTAK